jgi:non-heme chloroperoxidase
VPTAIQSVDLPNDVTLQYVEHGEGSGVPVLFLHGIGDSLHSFDLVMPHLPESIRTFALTQRGHGDSSRPEVGYRFHDFATDVVAFMDALELERAVVVGHSLGSTIAQRVAIDHPERIAGLVLIASFFSLPSSQAPRELWSVVSTMEDPVDPDFVREFQESTIARPVPRTFMEETIMHESMKLPVRVWREVVRCSLQDEFSGELDAIEAPTLLVWGDQDGMVFRNDQDALTAAIEGSQLVVYEGYGHAIPWEAPDRLGSDLVRFVETIVDQRRG